MKKKVLSLLTVIVLIVMLFTLSGCGNKKEETQDKENSSNQEEKKSVLSIDRAEDFIGDMAVVTHTSNLVGTHYVIDRNFKVLYSFQGNSDYKDGYMLMRDKDNTKNNIVDINGNVVFSYGDYDYEEVKLVDNGCIIITKKSDTYNSSNTVTGVYSLAEKKYILEPSEKYYNKIRTYGDNMLCLDNDETEFLNLRTKSVVKYPEKVEREFKDGFAVVDDNDNYNTWYLKVFDDKGNVKKIQSPYKQDEIVYGRKHQSGMNFETTTYVYRDEEDNERIRSLSAIFNLETGETKNLTDEFWIVSNEPRYTKDGYVLVVFSNQGGTPYYTVLDKKGNKLFEPQKVNNSKGFQPKDNGEPRKIVTDNLQEGNYFIVTDNDVYTIIDKENNIVLQAEENEIFEGITNNAVKVSWKKSGYYEQHYYKDLKGNKIDIQE